MFRFGEGSDEVVVLDLNRGAQRLELGATVPYLGSERPFSDWKQVSSLLAGSTSPDVVDAHMVVLAITFGDSILTGDPNDLYNITGSLGRIAPVIYEW